MDKQCSNCGRDVRDGGRRLCAQRRFSSAQLVASPVFAPFLASPVFATLPFNYVNTIQLVDNFADIVDMFHVEHGGYGTRMVANVAW